MIIALGPVVHACTHLEPDGSESVQGVIVCGPKWVGFGFPSFDQLPEKFESKVCLVFKFV